MTKLPRVTCLCAAALALALIGGFQPAQAACGAPFLITSIDVETGAYSYVVTPGTDGGSGLDGTSITEDFGGSFWAIGFGDSTPGVGADNGTFPGLAWMGLNSNYPAYILTTWAASLDIDGCIDVQGPLGSRCQATVLTDINPSTGEGVFALITTPDSPVNGDIVIVRPGDAPYNLAPAPALTVIGDPVLDEGTGLTFDVDLPFEDDLSASLYIDATGGCDTPGVRAAGTAGLILGGQVRAAVVSTGAAAPAANDLMAWGPVSQVIPLGTGTSVSVACDGGDVYLSYTLVFDGGFQTGVVSGLTASTSCGEEECVDNDGDGFGSPGSAVCSGGAEEDCDDDNPDVYPGAPELCDGIDNNCDGTVPDDEADDDADMFRICEGDCDDADATTYPGADQLCDGINNDCDDGNWPTVPADEADDDGDMFRICEGDCDDADATTYPGADQLCDGINNDCDDGDWPTVPADEVDDDGDNFAECEGDCNDADATTYPDAPQLCDRVNNDCNDPAWPALPADEIDADADGYTICSNPPDGLGDDCDDFNPLTNPGAPEICGNDEDNNCNGLIGPDDPECPPLLVELEYFTAQVTADGVVLRWATAVEVDNAGFRLLRSRTADKGGRGMVDVSGTIAPQGTPFSGAEYTFTDGARQPAGRVLYYLEDVDSNGRSTLHGPVRVNVGRRGGNGR